MAWLMRTIGAGLVFIALIDIYLTVLYPRSGKGLIGLPLSKGLWRSFRLIAASPWWTWVAKPNCGQRFLSYCGPTLLVLVVLVWVLLLLYGFAFIAWTALGDGVQAEQGQTPTDFATALYYSGYMLTTLGVGDIVPKNDFYRSLAILEAALGFSTFTLTITYLLAVYSALTQRNIFALRLHHQTVQTADAAELLARHGVGGSFDHARDDISDMALNLLTLLESHHAYPVVHYFRFRENYYALARVVFVAMETATLIRSALDQDQYRSLIQSPAVATLGDGGYHLLVELSNTFVPGHPSIKRQSETILRRRFHEVLRRLQQEGIATVPDVEQGMDTYLSLRWQWEPYVRAISDYMAYDWHDIAPGEHKLS